jgi:hypothetical protein
LDKTIEENGYAYKDFSIAGGNRLGLVGFLIMRHPSRGRGEAGGNQTHPHHH